MQTNLVCDALFPARDYDDDDDYDDAVVAVGVDDDDYDDAVVAVGVAGMAYLCRVPRNSQSRTTTLVGRASTISTSGERDCGSLFCSFFSSRLVSSCLVLSRHVSSCLVLSRLVSSCLVLTRLVSSRLILSRVVSSRLILSRLACMPRFGSF